MHAGNAGNARSRAKLLQQRDYMRIKTQVKVVPKDFQTLKAGAIRGWSRSG